MNITKNKKYVLQPDNQCDLQTKKNELSTPSKDNSSHSTSTTSNIKIRLVDHKSKINKKDTTSQAFYLLPLENPSRRQHFRY